VGGVTCALLRAAALGMGCPSGNPHALPSASPFPVMLGNAHTFPAPTGPIGEYGEAAGRQARAANPLTLHKWQHLPSEGI
jgi:hypothetical protein